MRRLTITGTGISLAVASAALAAAGVLLGYRTLVALAVGGVAVLVAGLLAVAVRPRVTLTRQLSPQRVTVGEPALGRLTVHNASRWPAPPFTAVDQVGAETIELPVGVIVGGGRRTVHYPVPTPRRGRVRLGPLTVQRRDPFGLFRQAQRQTADDLLWVHPQVHPMRLLPIGVVLDYEGRTTENARLGTVTFATLREYVVGDDPRHIHWRSTARTGTLIVREHVDTTEPTTTVVLDSRTGAMDDDAFEYAVEAAASVARPVEELGRPVDLRILGEAEAAAAAPATVAADGGFSLLDRLTVARRSAGEDPLALLDAVKRVPSGGSLIVVTGHREPTLVARFAEQRRRFTQIVVISMLDAADEAGAGLYRRAGLTVIAARTGADAAAAWNRMIGGDPA